MAQINSKEFATDKKNFYNLAQSERVVIKRDENLFNLTYTAFEDDDETYDLADAMAAENDENVNVNDYLKSIYERVKWKLK